MLGAALIPWRSISAAGPGEEARLWYEGATRSRQLRSPEQIPATTMRWAQRLDP